MPEEKILLVDDEPHLIEMLRYNLEREGFAVDDTLRPGRIVFGLPEGPGAPYAEALLFLLERIEVIEPVRV